MPHMSTLSHVSPVLHQLQHVLQGSQSSGRDSAVFCSESCFLLFSAPYVELLQPVTPRQHAPRHAPHDVDPLPLKKARAPSLATSSLAHTQELEYFSSWPAVIIIRLRQSSQYV